MNTTIEVETLRLGLITESPFLGICYLDPLGYKVTYFEPDPALKEAIIEYYRQRIAEMIRFQTTPAGTSFIYPMQED